MWPICAVLMGKRGVGFKGAQTVDILPPWLSSFCEFEQVMLVLHLILFYIKVKITPIFQGCVDNEIEVLYKISMDLWTILS